MMNSRNFVAVFFVSTVLLLRQIYGEVEVAALPAIDCGRQAVLLFRPANSHLSGYALTKHFGMDDEFGQSVLVCRANISGTLFYGRGYSFPGDNSKRFQEVCWIAGTNGTEISWKTNIQFMWTLKTSRLMWLRRSLFKTLTDVRPRPAIIPVSGYPDHVSLLLGKTTHYTDEGMPVILPGVVNTTSELLTVTYGGDVFQYSDYALLFCMEEEYK